MNNVFYFFVGLMFIVNGSIAFIPYWTRKTENFGVSIPESFYYRNDFIAMRKKYTTILLIINMMLLIGIVFTTFTFTETTVITIFTIVSITYIALSFLLYLPFHYKMKKMKHLENWQQDHKQTVIIDTKFHAEKLTFSNRWFLIPTFITIVTIAYTFFVYDKIPDQVPIHTSFSGKVTYDDKSVGKLLILPMSQLFILGILLMVNYVIKHSKQQVNAQKPNVSKQQNILFRRRWSLFTIITSILITILFTFMQLTFIYPALLLYENLINMSIITIILLGSIILSIATGQGGSRIKLSDESNDRFIDRDDDSYWKLGQFYFNKNDPSIFVEKRFGIGWTNNWANPLSWIFFIPIIVLSILIIYFISI